MLACDGRSILAAMKNRLAIFAFLFTLPAFLQAQSAITGTWKVEGGSATPWTLTLQANGNRLTGTASRGTAGPVAIEDGSIDGNTLSFTYKSSDGNETISFKGTITGEEIALTASGSARFTAKRNSYPVGGGVSAPRPVYQPEPILPEEALASKVRGRSVRLSAVVDAEGVPQDVRVIRPLGVGFDESAIDAVGKWRFQPGRKDGQPVPVDVIIDVTFHVL